MTPEEAAAAIRLRLDELKADIAGDIDSFRDDRSIGILLGNLAGNLSNLIDVVDATLTLVESKCR